KTVSDHKLYDILKQHQNEVNEIRVKRPAHHNKLLATRNRGKAIFNSPAPIYDQEPTMVAEDDEMINRGTGYDNQRIVNVVGARENVEVTPDAADNSGPIFDSEPLQKVLNNDNYNVFAIESKHPEQSKSVNDTYLIEQDEHNVIIDSFDTSYDIEQIDHDDDDDLANERDLLASLIEKLKYEIDDSKNRNKFLETSNKALVDKLKDIKKFQAELDRYNDVRYASKVEIDCAKAKGDLMSYKMEHEKASNEYTRKINDLNQTISEMKKKLFAHQETISIISQQKEAQIKFYKTREDKEIDKVIALENKVKVLDNIVYKTGQSVQTMNMLNHNCKMSFTIPEFLKKAQRANPRLYDIGCYNDNLALMLAFESDEVIRLEKESRSKLSDLIRPFDYEKLNNLYDLFVPQHDKSSAQRHFLERSKMSHTPVNNENSKDSFNKQTTLLEKRMDKSIPYDQKCKSSKELFKIKKGVDTIIDRVEHCKQTIVKRTYFGHIDLFIQNTIEGNFCPKIQRINADLKKFHLCLKEEMVADLRYFNSLKLEVDSLKSQLKTQKTQFLNEIDRLSREYYYINHMNAILEIVLFIIDSGCSKNMTENLKLLINFVEKFMGMVKFGNDQIAPILGYRDLVQGSVTIKRVYYVEGLNHNLFSAGQFCDADLEVAFRKSTCYICDLKGNDLLTGSRGMDFYSIILQDTNCPNPICLMAKASSSQVWLWHRRLSHLNFDTINLLSKNDIVVGISKLKFVKDHLCSSCELGKAKRKSFHTKLTPRSKRQLQLLHMDLCGPMRVASINGKRYVLIIVDDYSRYTWTHFLRSKDETPEVLIDFLRLVQRGLQAQVRVLIEIILFIIDYGCSKNMTGNLKLLTNFVEKFLDLEVAFRKSTCYIRDLKGNDLLTGSRGTDLYSITLQDTSYPNPICLISKATSSQAWLWHRRLSHLNFDTIHLLSKNNIMIGLPKLKFVKDHLCSSCELGKAK
nr:retrovirus-related Pol polyprotein from transposon TNT 1-94 [Tanacetum cinerariifolium]